MDVLDSAVPIIVVLSRLLVPLWIPRFPVPALLGALVIDAADQSIFSVFDAVPSDYQNYDKALDIYYLAIAYAATVRNWQDQFAFRIVRALFYFRLFGTALFELTERDWLLLAFPNVFEYAVLAYEAVRIGWNPRRLSHRTLLVATAVIWVVIKLPQEYWIHVAHLDVTDEASAHPFVTLALAAAAVLLAIAVRRVLPPAPPADWPATLHVDDHLEQVDLSFVAPLRRRGRSFWKTVGEKALLLTLVTIIFAQVLPVQGTTTQIALSVTGLVVANGVASQVFAHRGTTWRSGVTQFLTLLVVNVAALGLFAGLRGRIAFEVDPLTTGFVLLLLTLLITFYDRYRTVRVIRESTATASTDLGARSLRAQG